MYAPNKCVCVGLERLNQWVVLSVCRVNNSQPNHVYNKLIQNKLKGYKLINVVEKNFVQIFSWLILSLFCFVKVTLTFLPPLWRGPVTYFWKIGPSHKRYISKSRKDFYIFFKKNIQDSIVWARGKERTLSSCTLYDNAFLPVVESGPSSRLELL